MTALAGDGGEFAMEIDVMSALKDIVDAYDNTHEMVVTEAIANAIDVGATAVDVALDGRDKSISFHNNGPPMTKRQFKDYHVIARSSKSKGSGIGFAGVGAKVYLAAWDDTVIHTETADGRTALASDMYADGGTPKARYVKPRIKKRGTLYSVKLKPDDYNFLDGSITHVIEGVFGPAIDGGLKVTVNGARMKPWKPDTEARKKFTVSAKGARLPVRLTVTKSDLPQDKQGVQYHVSGKVITTRRPEWLADIKPAYAARVHAYVDATGISGHLNLNKTAFKSTAAVSTAYKETGRSVFEALKKGGYAKDEGIEKWEKTRLTRFFDKLFKVPEFAFLNPEARGGRGPGEGPGSGGDGAGGGGGKAGQSGERTGQSGERTGQSGERRGGGSLSIGFVRMEGDPREGWLDPLTSSVIINMEHPLFIKYEKVMAARSQRVAMVVTTALLKNATSKREMSAEEVLDMQSKVLTMAKDAVW